VVLKTVERRPRWETRRDSDAIACDVRELTCADVPALDALARLQLTARRFGMTIELHNASRALVDLIALVGLADVLVVVDSGVEMHGEIEEREQHGADEEVLGGDDAV
jgi:ABC-type transporter Mla MlaB component